MTTDHVDRVDPLCTGLLRAGRPPARHNDALLYSKIIVDQVEDLIPAVEAGCARWPEAYPDRCRAERLIRHVEKAIPRVGEMVEEVQPENASVGAGIHRGSVGRHLLSDSAEQQCEDLARAVQALKRYALILPRPPGDPSNPSQDPAGFGSGVGQSARRPLGRPMGGDARDCWSP